jgi:polysaccharide deacetylase family protein (PEP-CTERM system associated)
MEGGIAMNVASPLAVAPTAESKSPQPIAVERKHLLTVVIEDYFHVAAFERVIRREQWYRFETRLERNTLHALELLDAHHAKATFFVLGWVADRHPEIVKEVAARGHEIATCGYHHRPISELSPDDLRDELRRSRDVLQDITGRQTLGFRSSHGWIGPEQLWALDVIAEEGFAYDSSLMPMFRSFGKEQFRRFIHPHEHNGRKIWEVPPATWQWGGWSVPIAGGNYFRQFPHTLLRRAFQNWDQRYSQPFVIYFHVWELDPQQPQVAAASSWSQLRHYRNLDKMDWVLDDYLSTYRFGSIAEYLGLRPEAVAPRPPRATNLVDSLAPHIPRALGTPVTPVTIVVPCFNEAAALPYLANTLSSVARGFADCYDVRFVLVDDGSSDETWKKMNELFAGQSHIRLVQHPKNLGVAAAIMTGIRAADTEIVCSMDSDCSYDPHLFKELIPQLKEGVDLVTASPYHPAGGVRNVPGWRLGLSKGASWLYRRTLQQPIHTFTSCFRVYRRSTVAPLELDERGFLGVAELLARLSRQGSTIAEHPAVLETRVFGQSKMKVVRTILGHLRLLRRIRRGELDTPAAASSLAARSTTQGIS